MAGSDINMCNFIFWGVNSSNNTFACTDHYASANLNPPIDDTVDNVVYISTHASFGMELCDLEAVFERLLNTHDYIRDNMYSEGTIINAIWAYGSIVSS